VSPVTKKKTSGRSNTNGTKKSTAKKITAKNKAYVPSQEEVRQRAFELYQRRGAEPGRELEDWLAAEAELSKVR